MTTRERILVELTMLFLQPDAGPAEVTYRAALLCIRYGWEAEQLTSLIEELSQFAEFKTVELNVETSVIRHHIEAD